MKPITYIWADFIIFGIYILTFDDTFKSNKQKIVDSFYSFMQTDTAPFLCIPSLFPPRSRLLAVTAFFTDHKGCLAPVAALPLLGKTFWLTSGLTDSARVIASDLAGLGTHWWHHQSHKYQANQHSHLDYTNRIPRSIVIDCLLLNVPFENILLMWRLEFTIAG